MNTTLRLARRDNAAAEERDPRRRVPLAVLEVAVDHTDLRMPLFVDNVGGGDVLVDLGDDEWEIVLDIADRIVDDRRVWPRGLVAAARRVLADDQQ